MSNTLVTINLVVLNGEKYIRYCLEAVLAQSYPHELIEFNILDNGSGDGTKSAIENFKLKIENSNFSTFNFIENKKNLGMWPGQEELLKHSNGKYVLAMAVDVILDKDFIKNSVEIMEGNIRIGALEAKIYKYDLTDGKVQKTNIIDTCGFQIYKSRRITNIGHGEEDRGQYDPPAGGPGEIFGVEGAAPFFRKEALESCRIQITNYKLQITNSEIFDHDYFWYGDDLDLAWRMNLFGWKQVFAPSVIAWHDRQTTKSLKKNWLDYIFRVPVRHQIPIRKRRLDWRNMRWTIIKNDYTINILRDLPLIAVREFAVLGYSILFEPAVMLETGNFLKLLPKMLRKRKEIMKKTVRTPEEIHKYFK